MDAFAQWLTPFLSDGSLLALPLVVLGGLITAFNPCCLPMYPAVFGVIGGACCTGNGSSKDTSNCIAGEHTSKDNPKDNLRNDAKPLTSITLLFVLGMATATGIMGVLTAALGWVFGRFDSSFISLLAAIPFLMGLNLLGLLPFKIPSWRIKHLPATTEEIFKHRITAFTAGIIFSLAIAPCATPILLGILTLVAMKGNLFYGGVLMFVYGFGAGLPLLFIGHGFNHLQAKLTTSKYKKWLRGVSGLLLIGVAVYIFIMAKQI